MAVVSLWKRSNGSIRIIYIYLSVLTIHAFKPKVTTRFFFWKMCSAGVVPFTCVNMVSPTATASSKSKCDGMYYDCIALMIQIQLKWILLLQILNMSTLIECHVLVLLLSYPCPVLLTLVSICIAWLTSAQAGLDSSHNRCQFNQVRLPLVLKLLIKTYSITKSNEKSAHRPILIWITCIPSL